MYINSWTSLVTAGWASPNDIYIASNAVHYKYFEHWAFGKGIEISHVLNSGRSIGDSRVDCSTALLALTTAVKRHPGRDFLILAADAAPSNPGIAFGDVLLSLQGETSKVLIQPTIKQLTINAGPRITVSVTEKNDTVIVTNLVSSTASSSLHNNNDMLSFSCPIAYFVSSKDIEELI